MRATGTTLHTDPEPALAAIAELSALLAERSEFSAQIVEALIDLPHAGQELFGVDLDERAAGTGDLTVRLDPSDGFRMLLAALRAGDVDLTVIERTLGHDVRSRVEAALATVAKAGAGRESGSPSGQVPA